MAEQELLLKHWLVLWYCRFFDAAIDIDDADQASGDDDDNDDEDD